MFEKEEGEGGGVKKFHVFGSYRRGKSG